MAEKLTLKQAKFVDAYLQHGNATQAAREAGYAGDDNALAVTGHDNLRNPKIADLIRQRLEESAMPASEVLRRLSDQARGSVEDFVEIEAYFPKIDLLKAQKAGKLHLIKKLSFHDSGAISGIEFHSSQAALIQLGKVHKLFTDRVELTGKDGKELPALNIIIHGSAPSPETGSGATDKGD